MKKIKYLFFIAVAGMLLLGSCSKKNTPTPASASVSLKFNGTAYSTTNLTVTSASNTTMITGLFIGQSSVQLSIPNAKVGTYDVATSGAIVAFANGQAASDVYTSNTGTIVVTALTSTTISGTFAVSANNVGGANANITEGKFQANLP